MLSDTEIIAAGAESAWGEIFRRPKWHTPFERSRISSAWATTTSLLPARDQL